MAEKLKTINSIRKKLGFPLLNGNMGGKEIMQELDVLFQLGEDGLKPTQGYDDDFAHDMYAAKGVLVPPLTFKSVIIPTQFKTAFDPTQAGELVALRSGAAANTPLIITNAPGIIEGTYRGEHNVLVRNMFIDNSLVPFVFDIKGNRLALSAVPKPVLAEARQKFEEEAEKLGYPALNEEQDKTIFKTLVPRGTIYVAKHDRIAQLFYVNKIKPNFKESDSLPESVRGEAKFGSSGSNAKGGK